MMMPSPIGSSPQPRHPWRAALASIQSARRAGQGCPGCEFAKPSRSEWPNRAPDPQSVRQRAEILDERSAGRPEAEAFIRDDYARAIEEERDEVYLGLPKKLFVRLNALLPGLVDGALRKQHGVMRGFADGIEARAARQG
jgi:hypothetical protein